jgi:DUF3048 family protein
VARSWWPNGRASGRGLAAGLLLAVLVAAVVIAELSGLGAPAGATSTPTPRASAAGSSPTTGTLSPTSGPTPGVTPAASPPAITLVPAPLTGLLVTPEAALRHPMAVMIDDHVGARPQSGFNSASIVWQAPAEGGIPRYMLVFQDTLPGSVGPIRSAREYYIEWAAEWDAMYVHHGGSPQALQTLRESGRGQLVWNADGFVWLPEYLWRNPDRPAPHNVYTDGTHLMSLARRLGIAEDEPIKPVWTFAPDAAQARPLGSWLKLVYPYETVLFRYDPTLNAYPRYIDGSKRPQVDAADGQVVAPANVVLLRMHFGPLADSDPKKHRLEAADVGHGDAWILTGGRTIHGTWRKASIDAPTLLFDAKGRPIVFAPGQTFIQVLPLTYGYQVHAGKLAPEPPREIVTRLTPL